MKNTNIPFTGDLSKNLSKGFTPSGEYPNRKTRRRLIHGKKKITHGFYVYHKQYIVDDNGKLLKTIDHVFPYDHIVEKKEE